jgi:arylsulfatase A-like enzyme
MRSISLAWITWTALAAPAAAGAEARPSILVLLTDDLRFDALGCTGHALVKTPHIDRLARDGALFQNAFVTTSICCVSRASFLTGRYARSHRVADFNTPLAPEMLSATYPAILKSAGYRTGCLGKWGLGGKPPEGVFDFWDAWGGQGEYFHDVGGRRIHNSEYLALQAAEFLRGQPPDRPFCLIVNFKAPHDPLVPDPRDAGLFRDQRIGLPRTADEAHFERLPAFIRDSEGRTRAIAAHPTPERYQEFVKQYLRLIAGVDRATGAIMALLDELRLGSQTVVVFTSDNGFFLGERGLSHKWLAYEESIRIPMILKDPRAPAALRGKHNEELVLNIDLAPTLIELSGAKIPPEVDGRSLLPILRGESVPWRGDFFYEHHYHHGGKIPRTEAVRTRDAKYITYFDVDPPYEELYDLAGDPFEERNLAGDPRYAPTLEALKRRHHEYATRLGEAVLPPGPAPARRAVKK